ncbi:MAG: FecR domain-containing protein [Pseudomonadota bacterium]
MKSLYPAAFLLTFPATLFAQETPVGSAIVSDNVVRIAYGTTEKALTVGDDVIFGANISTGANSGNVDELADGTRLSIAADSRILVDEFVFDASSNSGTLSLRLAQGALRFVSGRMPSRSYEVRTPNAYLGIRGTSFVVSYSPGDGTTLYVEEGVVEFRGEGAGAESVAAGFASSVAANAAAPTPAAPPGPAAAAAVASVNVSVAVAAAPSVAVPGQLSRTAVNAPTAASTAASAAAETDDASFGGDGNY